MVSLYCRSLENISQLYMLKFKNILAEKSLGFDEPAKALLLLLEDVDPELPPVNCFLGSEELWVFLPPNAIKSPEFRKWDLEGLFFLRSILTVTIS